MPGGDRTGPLGRGPMTGRALGYCSGNNNPGFANPGYGPAYGRGRGRGLGRGYWGRGRGFWRQGYRDPYFQPYPYDIETYPQPNKDEEKNYLQDLIKSLEEEIKTIKQRLQELDKEKKDA